MKLTKTVAAAIAVGGLVFASAAPALAQHQGNKGHHSGSGHKGHGGGYKGHGGGHKGHHGGYSQNNGYKGHNGGQSHNNGYRGHNSGYRGQSHNTNRGHYGGYNGNKGHNQYRGYGKPRYYGHNNVYRPRVYHPPRPNYSYRPKPRYAWNPSRPVIYAPYFQTYYPNYRSYQPRFSVGYSINYNHYPRIYDYNRYGLYSPPHGHYWVHADGDAYLTAASTGLITGIVIGALLSD